MSSFTTAPSVGGGAAWLRRGGAGTAGASAASQPRSVVGDDIQLTAEHAAGLDATETHIISCLPDYRNRITEIIGFIRTKTAGRRSTHCHRRPSSKASDRFCHFKFQNRPKIDRGRGVK